MTGSTAELAGNIRYSYNSASITEKESGSTLLGSSSCTRQGNMRVSERRGIDHRCGSVKLLQGTVAGSRYGQENGPCFWSITYGDSSQKNCARTFRVQRNTDNLTILLPELEKHTWQKPPRRIRRVLRSHYFYLEAISTEHTSAVLSTADYKRYNIYLPSKFYIS